MTKTQGIDYFNRNHPLSNLQIQASLKIRSKIYDWFSQEIGGVAGKVILDHGSTPDTLRQDSNCFIRWLIEDGAKVYATSPEDITFLEQTFLGLIVLPWSDSKDNFARFDYIISSAVIEHVGNLKCQEEYLSNLFQLNANILLTTPNRSHWLEFHTKLPFLHWLPRKLHRAILVALGMKFWASEKNLNLLSRQDLESAIAASLPNKLKWRLSWYQPKFMGMISNLVVLIKLDKNYEY